LEEKNAMAKIVIENTREHDIILNTANNLGSVTIPAARPNPDPDAKDKLIPGTATLDDSFLKEAQKSEVVKGYFNDGWLRNQKTGSADTTAKSGTGTGQQPKP
jgi:hypothetical protein